LSNLLHGFGLIQGDRSLTKKLWSQNYSILVASNHYKSCASRISSQW